MAQTPDTERLVTDHAVLRYLERVLGIDVDGVRATILAGGRDRLIRGLGKGRIKVYDSNAELLVINSTVVTVTLIKPAVTKPAPPAAAVARRARA